MINLPKRYSNVLKTFSAGGMADTLLCEDANLSRKVVVKSLKAGIEPHRLLDELSSLSSIRSRYVVQVLDIIVETGVPVGFVEEYLEGADLKPLDPLFATKHSALRTLYPIAAGVHDIHEHGRVHRDLKPDNMRYDADGALKIFDFGLAKLNSDQGTKILYFTEGYTAPECFQKNTLGLHTFDFPVDVYAFGCVALWLLNNGVIPAELKGYTPTVPYGFNFGNLAVTIDTETASLLLRCLSPLVADRPTMKECKEHLSGELLRDQHKMVLTRGSSQYILDRTRRSVTIRGLGTSSASSIGVGYDGLAFNIQSVNGYVAINNAAALVGQRLTGSTVIVLGAAHQRRVSIACDVSHPEVMF